MKPCTYLISTIDKDDDIYAVYKYRKQLNKMRQEVMIGSEQDCTEYVRDNFDPKIDIVERED